jgi:hypothetical protein
LHERTAVRVVRDDEDEDEDDDDNEAAAEFQGVRRATKSSVSSVARAHAAPRAPSSSEFFMCTSKFNRRLRAPFLLCN